MSNVPLKFDPHDRAFNQTNALYLAHASDVAYHRSPAAGAMERLGLQVTPFRNKLTRTRGFLGICDTHAVLAFRETDPVTLPNWLTDMVVKLVRSAEYEGRVHHGFSSVLRQTWRMIEPLFEAVEDRPLFLTGHSMGGALAMLAGCRLKSAGHPPKAIYTYGSPRVGDPAFCGEYSLPTYRLVNRLDLVPEMPMASLQRLLPVKPRFTNEKVLGRLKKIAAGVPCYGHVNTLVYIDQDGEIITDAEIEPWHAHAVAKAIATRGKSFLDGVTDHMITSYIRALENNADKKHRYHHKRAVRRTGE